MFIHIIVCFLIVGAGVIAGPGAIPTSMSVTHSMQRGPVPGSSIGYPAQFLSSVVPVPQPSYSQQAVQAGVNYPQQVPRETLAPYVPLPHYNKPGMFELGETVFPNTIRF